MHFQEKTTHFACFSLFSQAEIIFPIWMNNLLNEYFWFNFELNNFFNEYFWFHFELNNFLNEYFLFNFELIIELNHFLARFNVKMNNQNVSATPNPGRSGNYYTMINNRLFASRLRRIFKMTKSHRRPPKTRRKKDVHLITVTGFNGGTGTGHPPSYIWHRIH